MDKVFGDMIVSRKTEKEKLAIVEFIIASAPKPGTVSNELFATSHRLIRLAIDTIRNGKDAFLIRQSFRVFEAWGIKEIRTSFFTAEEVSALLQEDCANTTGAITLLMAAMQGMKDEDNYGELCSSVARNASDFVLRHRRFSVLHKFCSFLMNFPECMPAGDKLFNLCESLLTSICFICSANTKEEITKIVKSWPVVIGGWFERVWHMRGNERLTMQCLEIIYPRMISACESHVSLAFGAAVQFLPEKLMINAILDIAKRHATSDEHIANIVSRLIDWLSWPRITNISNWLLLLLQKMNEVGRFELLKQVADDHIAKLLPRLEKVWLRENNMKILLFLVTGNQDSKKTFYEVIKYIPTLYKTIKEQQNPENDVFLADLSILTRSLILFHASKPELYKPILDLIGYKEVHNDDESEFKKQSWAAKSLSFKATPIKSIPGKTGLWNDGVNICYLNASIQLLAICESYSEQFMRRNFPATARISTVLQKYFVFLKLSNRPSLHCNGMARLLLPSSFTWGTVQDSSEFFSHLIDSTMEEEKSLENFEKLAKNNFYYTVIQSHHCLTCDNRTQLRVPNIDLGLAFESETASGNFGNRGGNQSIHSSDVKSEIEDYVLLEDMISFFLKPEEVREYDCDKCPAGKQVAEKSTTFFETPNFLKVTLNRFSYDHRGPQKITKATDIPRTLIVPVHRQNSLEHDVFCLVGVIVHFGIGANTGHYFCIARNQIVICNPPSITDVSCLTRDTDFFEDLWFEFNDVDISPTSFSAFSRSSSSSLSTPYVVLYKKVTDAVLTTDADSLPTLDIARIPRLVSEVVAKDNEEYEKELELVCREGDDDEDEEEGDDENRMTQTGEDEQAEVEATKTETESETDRQTKRAKITLKPPKTFYDLPMELQEHVLLKAIYTEIDDRKVFGSIWKTSADDLVKKLRGVCQLWDFIMTRDSFTRRLHGLIDIQVQKTIRLEILHQSPIQLEIIAVMRDDIFLLCRPGHGYQIQVFDRNNFAQARYIITLPDVRPVDLVACPVSNCLYLLNGEVYRYGVLRIANDVNQFNITPWMSNLYLSVGPSVTVSANGSVVIVSKCVPTSLSIYNANGSRDREIVFSLSYHQFRIVHDAILESNGNVVLVSSKGPEYNINLKEIDLNGKIVRVCQTSFLTFSAIGIANRYERILLINREHRCQLFDGELNPLQFTGSQELHSNVSSFGSRVRYNRFRNEIAHSSEFRRGNTFVCILTLLRFTEE